MRYLFNPPVCGQRVYIATHIQTVEEVVALGLRVRLEELDILEHLGFDFHFLVEAHRVFTQEVEDNCRGWPQSDVLVSQRATTHCIRFILALFITRTKRQTVDKVQRSGTLTISHHLGLEILRVVATNLVDVLDEFARLFKLGPITLSLPRTRCSEEDVLGLIVDVLFPVCKPGDCLVMLDRLPLAGDIWNRYRRVLANVDNDILWPQAELESTFLRVLTTTTEK